MIFLTVPKLLRRQIGGQFLFHAVVVCQRLALLAEIAAEHFVKIPVLRAFEAVNANLTGRLALRTPGGRKGLRII